MAEGADIKVVHETRASQPEGCLPFLPRGTLSYLVEVSLQVYGPAALKAGVCDLHQEEVVGHLSQTQLSTPHLPQMGRGQHGQQAAKWWGRTSGSKAGTLWKAEPSCKSHSR